MKPSIKVQKEDALAFLSDAVDQFRAAYQTGVGLSDALVYLSRSIRYYDTLCDQEKIHESSKVSK